MICWVSFLDEVKVRRPSFHQSIAIRSMVKRPLWLTVDQRSHQLRNHLWPSVRLSAPTGPDFSVPVAVTARKHNTPPSWQLIGTKNIRWFFTFRTTEFTAAPCAAALLLQQFGFYPEFHSADSVDKQPGGGGGGWNCSECRDVSFLENSWK